jgi:hypothetical protein
MGKKLGSNKDHAFFFFLFLLPSHHHCHNSFMSYSLNSPFSFQNKNKIIIARRLATWEKLVEEGFQTYRKIKL